MSLTRFASETFIPKPPELRSPAFFFFLILTHGDRSLNLLLVPHPKGRFGARAGVLELQGRSRILGSHRH
jgi:hypothetical protein